MKTVFFEVEQWEREALEAAMGGGKTAATADQLKQEQAAQYADAEIISCFIYSDLNAAALEKMPALKMIALRCTGYDHVDMEYCNSKGIAVANVPAYGVHTVAEHVFALLLGLSRHLPETSRRTRNGDFSLNGLAGFDLFGKTMGIVGTGSIGLQTARIARGFGMAVLASDPYPKEDMAAQIGFAYAPMKELLKQSDVISLHVPSTPETRNLLSEKEFDTMKPGVTVINTARGDLIDVKALLRALSSGKVRAAGLDVLPEEPTVREEAQLLHTIFTRKHDLETLLIDHALLRHKNVIVTPHSAFYTREAMDKIIETTARNIRAFLDGSPENIVNHPQTASSG